jgi:hypothetical protein
MKTWNRLAVAAIACAAGLTLACSGKTAGNGPGGSSGGGGNNGCDDYFQAIYAEGLCTGASPLPASEVTRIQARFATLCSEALTLPGEGISSAGLEACVTALRAQGCTVLEQNDGPCSFNAGTLPTGSACVTESQCTGGSCTAGNGTSDGGQVLCGTCGTLPAIGQPCADEECALGAVCNTGGDGGEVCVAITYGAAGATCNGFTTQCNPGLICNELVGQCAAPGGAGTACEEDQVCAAPLVCPSATGPSTCQMPGSTGAACVDDTDCTAGLGCGQTTHQCESITFAAAGQACSESIRCLVGSCPAPNGTVGGNCPAVIPDGQPCSESDTATCDTFANCEGGTCVLGYPSCP